MDNVKGLPDLKFAVLKLVAEDDVVAVHWKASGTNTGINNFLPIIT